MRIWLPAVLWLGLAGSALAEDVSDVRNGDCSAQNAAAKSAKDEYLKSIDQHGLSDETLLAQANWEGANATLIACPQQLENAKQQVDRDRKQQLFWDSPAGMAITKANRVVNGRVNVATFTPTEWTATTGASPWTPLGRTESRAFYFTAGSLRYVTYILLKSANKGPGDDYVSMDFISGEIQCRSGYPAGIERPLHTQYTMSGVPIVAAQAQGTFLPAEHGTVLARAIVKTCDQVRANGGNLNMPNH